MAPPARPVVTVDCEERRPDPPRDLPKEFAVIHRHHLLPATLVLAFGAVLPHSAAAQDAYAKNTQAVLATMICTPIASAAFDTRVHVRCSVGVSGIIYFALATSDANRAARALALFSTAHAAGRDLRIYYDPANTGGVAIGCAASDCRLADGVELL
jgi:hypothetical protein